MNSIVLKDRRSSPTRHDPAALVLISIPLDAIEPAAHGLILSFQAWGSSLNWSIVVVEFATLEWVDWFDNRRLLEPTGNIAPAEAEARYYASLETPAMAA